METQELSFQEKFLQGRHAYAKKIFAIVVVLLLAGMFLTLTLVSKGYPWIYIPAIVLFVICVLFSIPFWIDDNDFPKAESMLSSQEYTKKETEEKMEILSRIREALQLPNEEDQIIAICEATLGYPLSETELLEKKNATKQNIDFLKKQDDSFWKYFWSWIKNNNKPKNQAI